MISGGERWKILLSALSEGQGKVFFAIENRRLVQ
jgi:hypothetical protein